MLVPTIPFEAASMLYASQYYSLSHAKPIAGVLDAGDRVNGAVRELDGFSKAEEGAGRIKVR